MSLQDILMSIDKLPLEEQKLIQEHIEANKPNFQPIPVERAAGLGRGTIWISADFTAELPDEFWLGEQ